MNQLLEEITIYHQNEDKQWVKYHTKASVRNTSIRNRTTTGVSTLDNALIRIFDINGYNRTYFINKGDVIVRNKVYDEITNAPITELRKKYGDENVYQVKSIDKFIFEGDSIKDLQHIKIGAV